MISRKVVESCALSLPLQPRNRKPSGKNAYSAAQDRRAKLWLLILGTVLLCSPASLAQEATPTATPAPSPQELTIPSIAPDYRPAQKPLPELGRVGVEMDRQRPMSLREALSMALANNKDIEVARENVKIAEFDLKGARGAYDCLLYTSPSPRDRQKSRMPSSA